MRPRDAGASGPVILLAIPLLVIHVAFQWSILTAPEDSLAGLGIFVVPFELLLGTMLATVVAGSAVARSDRRSVHAV